MSVWYNHEIRAWVFSWLTHVFTPSIHSWTFLVIIISISTYELTIIATKITKIGQLGPKIWHFPLYRVKPKVLACENAHISGPN